jgi:hypothetical protein
MTLTDIEYETADLRDQFCQDLVWWKNSQDVEDSELLRRIMNLGTWEMWQWARNKFPVKFFIDTLTEAKYGDFSSGSWHYWHIKLEISPIPRLPKNQFLGDGVMLNFPGS